MKPGFGALAPALLLFAACNGAAGPAPVSEAAILVSFAATDGGVVWADEYGAGEHAVVLAHGARFDKSSWTREARVLAASGFRVLAIDFRGYGRSRAPAPSSDPYAGLHFDVLGAVRFLRASGAKQVSVIGGSMGGWAAAQASIAAEPGAIDRLVLLASSAVDEPARLQGRKLFITAREDPFADGSPRLAEIQGQYERAPEPKELVVLEGSAHAQHIFATEQGERLMQAILRFLTAP